jgi:type VI secretion system secreted protein VgrG
MSTIDVQQHLLKLVTPLGPNFLVLLGLRGREAVSEPFRFELDVAAERAASVDFDKLLGQPVAVQLTVDDSNTRHFAGIVSRVAQGPRDERLLHLRLEVVPKLWLLGRRRRSRIFQHKSVPDILKEVFAGLDVTYDLKGTYEPRNFCTQYRESDLEFASRLMEEEGIFYFFRHTASGHPMVVGDAPAAHPELPVLPRIAYDAGTGAARPQARITAWEKVQELTSSKTVLWDHTFELPDQRLDAEEAIQASVAVGTVTHKLKVGPSEPLEDYDYPGGYARRFDGVDAGGGDRAADVQKILQDNKRTVKLRMQETAAAGIVVHGTGDCRQLTAGHRFTLERHFDANGAYVVLAVEHEAKQDYTTGSGRFEYQNRFTCLPHALPYRPPRRTTRPTVAGCQTATVVGPSGEEIFVDKYGRVKVQFHWDREGRKDAKSSCWVRVATSWAGKQWGAIHIPRIGQEVVIDFLEGDPDRPIIVGSVYNAEQMPPYKLPANKTQSGVKSRSSKEAAPDNFNEIRFEDKKDAEQIYIHAEKNMDAVVENNETRKVGFEKKDKGDQTVEIFNNQTLKVGAGAGKAADGSQTVEIYKDQTVTLKEGDQTTTVEKGDQTVKVVKGKQSVTVKGNQAVVVQDGNQSIEVGKGNRSLEVKQGNRKTVIGQGNDALEIKMGNQTIELGMGNRTVKVKLGKIAEEAMQGIELKVGGNSIKIDQTGVTIKGMTVKIEGQVQTEVKGLITQINGSAMLKMQGGITMIN